MVGQPYNPDNCAFLSSQSLNANQFNPNVPYSTNNTTHLILWDFVEKKILWVNSQTNLIESEIGGSDIALPANVGNLVVNETSEVESTLVREYVNGELVISPIQTITATTTNETIAAMIYIPANTYKIGDYWETKIGLGIFEFVIDVSNSVAIRTYFNNSPNLSGAILSNTIAGDSGQGTNELGLSFDGKQKMKFTSNNTVTGSSVNAGLNPFVYNQINLPIFDITQDAYFILTFQFSNVSSDRAAVFTYYANKILNAQKLVP